MSGAAPVLILWLINNIDILLLFALQTLGLKRQNSVTHRYVSESVGQPCSKKTCRNVTVSGKDSYSVNVLFSYLGA